MVNYFTVLPEPVAFNTNKIHHRYGRGNEMIIEIHQDISLMNCCLKLRFVWEIPSDTTDYTTIINA